MAPGTRVPNSRATARKLIILRVDVEESNLLNLAAVGVLGDGADVKDTETGLVVGLVGETLVDELVVVERPLVDILLMLPPAYFKHKYGIS